MKWKGMDAKTLKFIAKFTAIVVPFSFIVALLYHLAYWSFLGINIFPFLSVDEVVVSAIVPLCAVVACTVVMFIAQAFVQPFRESNESDVERTQKDIVLTMLLLITILGVMFYSLMDLLPLYFLITIILFVPVSIAAMELDYLKKRIGNKSVRFALCYAVLIMPLLSFTFGERRAFEINNNMWGKYASASDLTETRYPQHVKLIYLGKAGDYFIFRPDSSNELLVTQLNDFRNFRLLTRVPDSTKTGVLLSF